MVNILVEDKSANDILFTNDESINDNAEIMSISLDELTDIEPDISVINDESWSATCFNHSRSNELSHEIVTTNQNVDILNDNTHHSINQDQGYVNSVTCDISRNVHTNDNHLHDKLEKLRCTYRKNLILSHLNVNSLSLKRTEVSDLLVRSKFEVLVLSETKLDNSHNSALFEIENYCMYRQDKKSNSGGLMIYVSKSLPSTQGNVQICNDEVECLSVEITCEESKILLLGMYKNPKTSHNSFKSYFEITCEEIMGNYENIVIIGDLNFNMLQDNVLSQLCPAFNLTNIITEPTCFKSNNASLIDVMLVTKRRKFLKGFSLDTGISDFHNLIGGVMRQHAPVPPKKTIIYRQLNKIDYEKVNDELFMMSETVNGREWNANEAFDILHNNLICLLDKYAPKKTKILRKNDFHCMSKALKKAILLRNQMRNKFFKCRSRYYLAQYRKHRNAVTLIKREEIKKYFAEKCQGSTKNKDFWKAVKPIFSKTKTKSDNIPLRHDNKIITDSSQVCEIFNTFFSSIGSEIGSPENNDRNVETIITGYENHPSILMIRNNIMRGGTKSTTNFDEVTEWDVKRILSKLSSKKASGYDEIPVKFLKMTSNSLVKPLTKIINTCLRQNVFPDRMKMANITPLYKKKDKLDKDNYRSVNLLISLSKILEKVLYNQISDHMQLLFHKYLSGFRKGHGCHDILNRLTEDWRQALDDNSIIGVIAIDLSKAFDCMPHGLLIAKLHAYGFSLPVCKLMKSYLVNRKQRVKIGETFSGWTNTTKGVPQGSILGPLLFNIFINDFLFCKMNSKVYNYADDNTLSYIGKDIEQIKSKLKVDCLASMQWFESNNMKANAGKFQLMFLSKSDSYSNVTLNFETCVIQASTKINILGVEFDDKLKFNYHIDEVCNQTSKQINALKRMRHFLDRSCRKTIYNSYVSSNFNYCSIIWMFSGKVNMDKLENTNKRALRFVLNDNEASYDDICQDEKLLCIYNRCIKAVAIQMYKVKYKMVPEYIQELFSRRESNYDIRDNDLFDIPRFESITYGKKSFSYYGAKLWTNLPKEIKGKTSLVSFKSALTSWLLNKENLRNIEFL